MLLAEECMISVFLFMVLAKRWCFRRTLAQESAWILSLQINTSRLWVVNFQNSAQENWIIFHLFRLPFFSSTRSLWHFEKENKLVLLVPDKTILFKLSYFLLKNNIGLVFPIDFLHILPSSANIYTVNECVNCPFLWTVTCRSELETVMNANFPAVANLPTQVFQNHLTRIVNISSYPWR